MAYEQAIRIVPQSAEAWPGKEMLCTPWIATVRHVSAYDTALQNNPGYCRSMAE